MIRRPPRSTRTDTLFPYTTLFRSSVGRIGRQRLKDWIKSADIPLNVALPRVENRYIEAQLAIEQVSLEACFDIAKIFRLEGWSERVSKIHPPSQEGAARLHIYKHQVVHFEIKPQPPRTKNKTNNE